MLYINVWITVKDPANVDAVRGMLTECGRLSRDEPGCVSYQAFHSKNEPTKFLLAEHWADEDAWKAHRTAKAYTEIYAPKVIPLVDRTPHPSDLLE
jgi:quinol monooxygenase YgiN